MKIKLALNGLGGELESHIFETPGESGGDPDDETKIRRELLGWLGDRRFPSGGMILSVGDTITITEVV
jgi:hypothetical protein